MISGAIKDLDENTLQALITNQVPEGKTIEYKREFPGTAESKEIPLLATVASFANTYGGDLLIGVEASEGLPTQLVGVEIENVDGEILPLDHVLRSGLEPRVPHVDIRTITVGDGRYILVIRVPTSWNAPHRVRQNSKFYARNSAGRYELDVGELRTAFTMTESVAQRIRDGCGSGMANVSY